MRTQFIETQKKEKCCGCSACEKICPVDAITMQCDSEGFFYPLLQEDKCINCGKCASICPMENINKKFPIKTYAAVNINTEILKVSSSGGAFRVFASEILKKNGMVCGAIIENNVVFHVLTDDLDTVSKMSGSKYVQSDLRNVYKEILYHIKDRKILFTGTPCQCAGIRNLLPDSNNLFTMDFVCHGVPSPAVFNDYVNFLRNKYGKDIEFLKFRSKDNGHIGLYDIFKIFPNKIKIKPFYDSYYLSGFQMALFTRLSCNICPYSTFERCSDITVCDYWGIEKYHKEFDPIKGVSGVLINTEKGQMLFNQVQNEFYYIDTDINNLSEENSNLHISTQKNPKRDDFFSDRSKKSFELLAKEYMNYPGALKFRIKDLIPYPIKKRLKNAINHIRG